MTYHKNFLGAAAVHQIMYVQNADPGAVGKRKFWLDTTGGASLETGGILKQRDEADTGWTVRAQLGTAAAAALDTDTTLAANSDTRTPSQKAIKAYVGAAVTGLWEFKGTTDTSANPNYPAASKGDAYLVSVAGKIGGASGKSVDVGDVYIASADNAGGTEASVGTSWFVLEHNLTGAGASTLDGLTDVNAPSPSGGDVLTFDGSEWVPQAPGAGSGAEVLIAEHVVAAGGEASVTFSSIAATYRDLRIVVRGRGTASATFVRPRVRFNADTGNNYNWNRHTGHGTTTEAETAAGVAFIDTGVIPAATATASFAGSVDIRVFDYRGVTFFHSVLAACHGWAVSEHYVMNGGGLWKSASAITSVTVLLDSGNYAENSVISLYGIY